MAEMEQVLVSLEFQLLVGEVEVRGEILVRLGTMVETGAEGEDVRAAHTPEEVLVLWEKEMTVEEGVMLGETEAEGEENQPLEVRLREIVTQLVREEMDQPRQLQEHQLFVRGAVAEQDRVRQHLHPLVEPLEELGVSGGLTEEMVPPI